MKTTTLQIAFLCTLLSLVPAAPIDTPSTPKSLAAQAMQGLRETRDRVAKAQLDLELSNTPVEKESSTVPSSTTPTSTPSDHDFRFVLQPRRNILDMSKLALPVVGKDGCPGYSSKLTKNPTSS